MRRIAQPVLALACLSFLSIQVSGSHLHAESGAHVAAESHSMHLQNAFVHDRDHAKVHIDLSLFEIAATLSKIDGIITASAMPGPVAMSSIGLIWKDSLSSFIRPRGIRWRPPSRASPSF